MSFQIISIDPEQKTVTATFSVDGSTQTITALTLADAEVLNAFLICYDWSYEQGLAGTKTDTDPSLQKLVEAKTAQDVISG